MGEYETALMAGARAVMTDSILAWRDIAADSFNRTGELRNGVETGAWARIYGGESKYKGGSLNIENSYKAVQVGFDKEIGDWTVGTVIDYREGESDYMLGGEGEHKNYSLGIYGTKDLGNGSYLDVAAKSGHVENDYDVYNEIGRLMDGEYSVSGYSISAQYGKRFESGKSYLEPQLQLTWAHIDGDDYTAVSKGQTMDINQEAFDSFVGRIGIEAGQESDHGRYFARLSLNHEFNGDTGITCR
ncbi:outer membrane autotransporter barrel domain protein, partial [gut metagenome]